MQAEFEFQSPTSPTPDGLALWRKQREDEQLALAKRLGLPIGHDVEIWLRGGVRLRGRLQLHDAVLLHSCEGAASKFAVDTTPFLISEMESCTRL